MAINYIEKGYGMWEALAAAGLRLHNRDGVFYSNPNNFSDTSGDAVVQAFIDAYDPLPYHKKQKIAAIKAEGVVRANEIFEGIKNFGDLDLVAQIMLSIAAGSRTPTTRITALSNVWTAGNNAVIAVNACTTIAQVNAVTPSWP